jgi:hypothetical protein
LRPLAGRRDLRSFDGLVLRDVALDGGLRRRRWLQTQPSYGLTVQVPNLNVHGCAPVSKRSIYLQSVERLPPL